VPKPKNLAQIAFLLAILLGSIVFGFALQTSVTISSTGSIYYQPEPKILLEDSFESGDYSVWNGTFITAGNNTASVASTDPYEGSYHSYFQTDGIASGVNYAYCYEVLSPAISEVYARGYFKIVDGLPLNDENDRFGLISFEVGGWLQCSFRVLRSGGVDRFNIVGYNGSSSVTKSSDAVYPVEGKWYCFEFFVKLHPTKGEYRVWINGVERITMTNLNTVEYGSGVSRVRFGLTYTANVQHYVKVYCDSVVVSTRYVGQLRYTFGVIGSVEETPAISNFYWLFGNQSISYRVLLPSEITNFADVDRFDGLVVWTRQGGYNVTAIKQFAQSRITILHMKDFCTVIYRSLSSSMQVVATNTVTYLMDWGNFRSGDLVEMRNETGNIGQLTTVLLSGLTSFSNVTAIARYDASRIAFFHMNGTQAKSGFYVMDLDATTPSSEWVGIWHLFPAIKMVKDYPTGEYARWMANGQSWWDLTWIYNRIDALVSGNRDIMVKMVMGQSVQGRNITAMVIGKGSRNIIIDVCHANEKAGAFACLRIVELLVEFYRSDALWQSRLLNDWRVIVIPVLNPDGFVANTRENANGKDLNRQYPPGANTTEPEAWALRWLMDNYTPTVYINLHEGYTYYPNWMIYGNYEVDPNRTITVNAMKFANATFVSLKDWGWFDENGEHVWIGKVSTIAQGGINSMAVAYASSQFGASCMLLESIAWSPAYNARQCLWDMDYYCTLVLAFLENNDRLS
jgi:hypothetical protein